MAMNKIIKFFLVLIIPFTAFFSFRFVCHAENLYQRKGMPLLVSPGYNANQGKPWYVDLSNIYDDCLNFLRNDGYYNPSIKGIFYEGSSSNDGDDTIYITCVSEVGSYNISGFPDLTFDGKFVSNSDFTFSLYNGLYNLSYSPSTRSVANHSHTTTPFVLSSFLSGNVQSGYTLDSNTYMLGYPLYISSDILYMGNSDQVIFEVWDGTSDEGSDIPDWSGTGSTSNYDENGDPIGSSDFNFSITPDLSSITSNQESIKESLDDMKDTLDSILSNNGNILGYLQTILGKLTDSSTSESWLEKIFGSLEDIKGEIISFFGIPSEADFQDAFEESDLNDILDYFNDLKESVTDMFNVNAKTQQEMSDIYYLFEWDTTQSNNNQATYFNVSQGIHFSFAWYESIRSKFLTVLFAFIYAGMICYCMKQVPNIINGVGSSINAGQSISHNDRKGE